MLRLRTSSFRVTALVVVALFVSARAASIVHEAFVSHVVCAEHGELIHADAVTSEQAPAPEGHLVFATGDAHDDHDHCFLAILSAPQAPASSGELLALRPAPQRKLPNPAVPPAPKTRHLQRLAPKTSPPRMVNA